MSLIRYLPVVAILLGASNAADPETVRTHRDEAEAGLGDEMRRAEREAREYLNRAKERADGLVNAMIGAVEREAAEMRSNAEAGIRERWRAVEAEAGRYLEDAHRVADGMVTERQARISGLSDGIVTHAEALVAGMEDAERVRRQFESFVRASESFCRLAHGGGRRASRYDGQKCRPLAAVPQAAAGGLGSGGGLPTLRASSRDSGHSGCRARKSGAICDTTPQTGGYGLRAGGRARRCGREGRCG